MSFVLTSALYLGALWLTASVTPSRGLRLLFALMALIVGVGVVNVMIEAVVFDVLDLADLWLGSVFTVSLGVFLSLLAMIATGKLRDGEPAAPAAVRLTLLRGVAVIAAYIALYFAAGMLVYPFVADFYAGTELPELPELLGLQALRGAIYLVAALPLLRLGPRRAPLVLGVAFALIAGLAPLAAENEFLPGYVRAYHAIEIAVSNFLFGLFMGWILAPRPEPPEEEEASDEPEAIRPFEPFVAPAEHKIGE